MTLRPAAGYAVLSVIFGLTLAAAAGLKAAELLFGASHVPPPVGLGRLSAAMSDFWPGVEFALGLWLVSGARPVAARGTGVVVLLGFCGVTLSQLVAGSPDCGCFGPVGVSPAATLAFDLTILVGLLAFRPRGAGSAVRWGPVVLAVGFFVGCAALPPLLRLGPAERFEVVDTSDWVGRRFPLLEETDIADRLRAGNWLVVLHRPDCEACRRGVPRFIEQARTNGAAVALVEVPVAGSTVADEERDGGVSGHLRRDRTWVVRTPLAVWIKDGVVTGLDSGSP